MSRACSTHEIEYECILSFSKKKSEEANETNKTHDVDRSIILKWALEKQDRSVH